MAKKKVKLSDISWGNAQSGSLAGQESYLGLSREGMIILTDTSTDTLHVTSPNGTGTATMKLEQLDPEEPFIHFSGSTASDQTKSLTTDTSVGSLTGHVRVSINGTDYWIPYYATN